MQTRMFSTAVLLTGVVGGVLSAGGAGAQSNPGTFGSVTHVPFALKGDVHAVPTGTSQLPDFSTLTPIGTIYATDLNVTPRAFDTGFPGVPDRFEWFAIDYNGQVARASGSYTFRIKPAHANCRRPPSNES